jgi:hypothetical protein
MPKIIFYRQCRRDHGVRTGVDIDGTTVLHLFERGEDESDPVLLWYVDLRCQGAALPAGAEEARQWLLDQAATIRSGFKALAEEVSVGIDANTWPLQWKVPKTLRGVRMTIVCSAVPRLEGRDIANVLADIGAHWEEIIRSLLVGED